MDIPRRAKSKRRTAALWVVGALIAIAGMVALTRLGPAAPAVARSTLWIDTVRRGPLVRQVRAPGTLVPERVRIISALTAGRVERLAVRPGSIVTEGTVLLELSNPDVQLQALEAERQLGAAEANLVSLRSQLEMQRLQQQGVLATVMSDYNEAKRSADVIAALDAKGLSSANEVARARDRVQELASRRAAEQGRLDVIERTLRAQLSLEKANVERMRAVVQFQRSRLAAMRVVSGEAGVVQEMPLELGQWVVSGQLLARVAQPGRLKAELRVPETQAPEVVLGQPVAIDTRNGVVPGLVARVDPAVQNGTVRVEVSLEGTLPKGARPDLTVDGTIEVGRLRDVLSVGRPAYAQPNGTVSLFVLSADGESARRVQVRLGLASVDAVEVLQGLDVGDRVILSDVAQWDGQDRLRIR